MSSLMRAYASRYLPRLTRSRYPWIFSFVPHALLHGGILSRYTGRMARQLPVGNRSWPLSCEGAGVIPANGTASQSGMSVPLVDMVILTAQAATGFSGRTCNWSSAAWDAALFVVIGSVDSI